MSHFAKIDSNNIVTEVIVAEQDFINSGAVGDSFLWVQTSYNGNFRKNYAGKGMTYDKTRDAFIPPKPYASWTLVEATCQWEAPVAYPDDGKVYNWDESSTNWVEVVQMALTKIGKEGITGISNASDATALYIDSSERVGVGATPNATFGSHLYAQGTPAANKPIISAYSQGNSNKAGLALFNDAGNRGIWTDSSNLLFTATYEGNSTEHMRIDSSGNVLVSCTATMDFGASDAAGVVIEASDSIAASRSGNATLWLKRFGSDGAIVNFYKSTSAVGSISVNGSATAYNTSSDYRLKENVDYDWDATTRLKQLKPARFNFIADADKTVDGFLAHEAQVIVPEAITGTKDAMTTEVLYVEDDELPDGISVGDVKEASVPDYQGIDQSKLVPLLVKTIQELEARLTAGGL